MNSYRSILISIFGLIYTILQPQITLSYTAEEIGRIAKEVTVIIDGNDLGSGVLIGHDGYNYSVLTNWHVLASADNYTVTTKDGEKYSIKPSSIKRIAGLDLGLFTFTSTKLYRTAEFGNSDNIAEGSALYVTGAPANLQGIERRSLLVVGGQLVGYDAPSQTGYTLIYNNNTMPGMSGGSVMDKNGNLVGIHGKGSRDANGYKSGFNLGIPINLFVSNASRLGIKYTATYPRLQQDAPSPIPSGNRGRPIVIDGSENTNGACPGDKC